MTKNKKGSGVPWGKHDYTKTQKKIMFELHKLGLDIVELHLHQDDIARVVGEIETNNDIQIGEIALEVKTYLTSKFHKSRHTKQLSRQHA